MTIEERFAFNVSLRMFTRSIVIQRRVEDLQLGVESYQKRLNLTKPDTYRSDLKQREAYTAYSNPQGFIYQNKDKKNRLMQIDELHKFSDGTLNDVCTALDDRLKGIRMQYLPQTIWRKGLNVYEEEQVEEEEEDELYQDVNINQAWKSQASSLATINDQENFEGPDLVQEKDKRMKGDDQGCESLTQEAQKTQLFYYK
nr:hypothetical protein [Tanacetum cinerariifolium]